MRWKVRQLLGMQDGNDVGTKRQRTAALQDASRKSDTLEGEAYGLLRRVRFSFPWALPALTILHACPVYAGLRFAGRWPFSIDLPGGGG
jgi:hypothetical protein